MARGAGTLDRRLQFRAATTIDDGLAVTETWANTGPVYPCRVAQFRADEAQAGGQVQAKQSTRFTVRYDAFTSTITPLNRIVYEGDEYDIVARQEAANTRRAYLEFVAAARADL
jgi:head-tail adaptor